MQNVVLIFAILVKLANLLILNKVCIFNKVYTTIIQ